MRTNRGLALANLLLHKPIDTDHPLFGLGVRRRRWWQRGHRPLRYGIEVVVWTVLMLTVAWAVMVLVRYMAMVLNNPGSANYRTWNLTNDIMMTVLWSGAVSLSLSYLLDFIVMALTVNSISGERTAHRWDLLELTPLTGQSIVETLHSTNQLRVWRMTMIVVGTRIATLVCLLMYPFVLLPVFEGQSLFDMLNSFWYNPIQNTYVGMWLALLAFVWVIEPVWRLRATTALGMAISAQYERLVIAMSVAFLSMVGIWVTMIGVVGGMFWGLVRAIDWLYDQIGYSDSDDVLVSILVLTGFALMAFTIYGGFWLIRWGGLRWTARKSLSHREPWAHPPRPYRNPWWNFIRWWLPHGAAWQQSPVFDYKVRRVPWWHSMRSPRHRFNYAVLWAAVPVLLVYAAGVLVGSFILRGSSDVDAGATLIEWGRYGIAFAGIGGLLLLIVLDIFTSLFASESVHRIRVALDDDLLRLTFLNTGQIVEAYRALARVRIWTFTAFVVGFGLSLLVLLPVNEANLWAREGSVDFCSLQFLRGLQLYENFFDSGQNIELSVGQCLELYRGIIVEYVPLLTTALLAVIIIPIAKTRLVVALTLAIVTRFNGATRELLRAGILLILLAAQCWLAWDIWQWGAPGWGTVLGAVLLLLLLGYAVERGALALTRYFIWRERVDRHAPV
ncbi:MAG: hypothetical protein AAFU54_22650 [Chloroflexota bacterium]